MNDGDLESFLRTKKELIRIGNMSRVFSEVYDKVRHIDRKIFFDFLGELLLEKPLYLKGKNHTRLLKQYSKFKLMKVKSIRWGPLEEYFIKKYCIFEGEELKLTFIGVITYRNITYNGRVFVTNYRIILIGTTLKQSHVMPLHFGVMYHLFENTIRKGILKSSLKLTTRLQESKDVILFGYQFPIINAEAINLKKKKGEPKSLAYTSRIHDGKTEKLIKLRLVIYSSLNADGITNAYQKIVEILSQTPTEINTVT